MPNDLVVGEMAFAGIRVRFRDGAELKPFSKERGHNRSLGHGASHLAAIGLPQASGYNYFHRISITPHSGIMPRSGACAGSRFLHGARTLTCDPNPPPCLTG